MKLKKLAVNLIVLLVTLIIIFAAFELILRLFFYQNPVWNQYHEYFVYTSNRGSRFVAHDPEGGLVEMTINERGYRGPVIPYENTNSRERVFIVGDSFLECFRPGLENCFSTHLQGMLGDGYEVIAMGTASWALDNEYKVIELEGVRYDPDVVIVAYYVNDLWDASRRMVFSVDENGSLQDNTPIEWGFNKKLFFHANQYSFVVRFLTHSMGGAISMNDLAKLLGASSFPKPEDLKTIGWGLPEKMFTGDEVEVIEDAYAKADLILDEYRGLSEEHGFRLVFAMIPLKEQVSDMRLGAFKGRMNLTDAFDVDLPYERMMSLIREHGMEVIDPRESMAALEGELEEKGKSLYYEDDAHFNPAGQRAFGEMIYERIRGSEGIGGISS